MRRELKVATVPRVAARAGSSPGSVYRRFPNKDALMRAVDLGDAGSARRDSRVRPNTELAERLSLQAFTRRLCGTDWSASERMRECCARCFEFILSHTNIRFGEELPVERPNRSSACADFLLLKRSEIEHPDPKKAFAIRVNACGSHAAADHCARHDARRAGPTAASDR